MRSVTKSNEERKPLEGKFITLEGGEGVGKTTNLAFIQKYLESRGVEVIMTREPGGTPYAEMIRDLLLHKDGEKVSADTELLLMFASRAQHIAQLIKPALAAGKWVVCSRFTDSTYAYQGGGRGIAFERIATLENWVHGNFQPDLTLLLDVPVEIGMGRARQRALLDRIEREKNDFFERVRQAYLQRAKTASRYKVVDASQTLVRVQSDLKYHLDQLL
jgi:dTMP kinase